MIQHWLAAQLRRVDSVQRCQLAPDNLLIVHSWRGVIVHLHLLDQPLKPRQLRKIAADNTRVGVGTLFILKAALVPADGAQLVPDEWLAGVHALTDDKLYTWRLGDDAPHIGQVHFKPTNKPDQRDVWHGPDLAIRQLPFYRVWVRQPASLKGDYLIANFESEPFWRDADFRQTRADAAERARVYGRAGGAYTRVEFGMGGVGQEIIQRPPTRLEASLRLLGVEETADCDAIKAAFRRRARELHPDTSTLPKDEAERQFHALTEAYTYLKEARGCG